MSATLGTIQHDLALLNEYSTSSELGILLSSTLFGVFCVQVCVYHRSRRVDSVWVRALVAWVFVVEAVHTGLLWYSFISIGNRSRLNPQALVALTPELAFVYFTSGVLGTTVQAYYASRLYLLSGSIFLALFAWVGSVARLALTVLGAVLAFRAASIVEYMARYGWCMKAIFGASVVVDVWNTFAICCIFTRRRSGQQYPMALVIDKLTMWAVETGLITTILAGLMLIFTLVGKYTLIPALVYVYPNMFSLSLLLTLNGRDGMWKTLLKSRNSVNVVLPVHVRSHSCWPRSRKKVDRQGEEPLTEECMERARTPVEQESSGMSTPVLVTHRKDKERPDLEKLAVAAGIADPPVVLEVSQSPFLDAARTAG